MKALIGLLMVITVLWIAGRLIGQLLAPLVRYLTGRILWGLMLKMGQQRPGMNEFANRLDKYFWKACRRHKLKLTDEARLSALMPIVERYGLLSNNKTPATGWEHGIDLFVYQLAVAQKAMMSKSGIVDATLVVKVLVRDETLLTRIFTEGDKQAAAYPG